MTPERYREIDRMFQEAAELAAADRAAFLDTACGEDHELRREVESLLAHDAPDTRLERSVRAMSASVVSEREPERLGPYRVTGVIGRGGMGVVYAAVRDDDAYRKQVAVKLVKRGTGNHNQKGVAVRTKVKAGGIGANHTQSGFAVRSKVKAGGLGSSNHNQSGVAVRSRVKAGALTANHNQSGGRAVA